MARRRWPRLRIGIQHLTVLRSVDRDSFKAVVSMEEKKNVELEHVYALKLSQIPMDTETSRKLSKRVKN